MKPDETISSIIYEIQEEIFKEKKVELSPEEIFNIVNSQFIGGAVAVSKRISFDFKYMCSFVLKNKQAYVESVKEIEKLKEKVSEEEYKKIVKQKQIDNKETMNASKLYLVDSLEELPSDLTNTDRTTYFNAVYKKILNQEDYDV